jgi:hypothetical protein
VGIVLQAGGIANGATGTIQIGQGLVTTGTWTAGGDIYVGTTAGAISQSLSGATYAKPLGYAPTTTQIFFNPEPGWTINVT